MKYSTHGDNHLAHLPFCHLVPRLCVCVVYAPYSYVLLFVLLDLLTGWEMCATSETDEIMMPNNDVDSPTADDANSAGSGGVNSRLKKGPWTSAEDAILVEYVTKHGEGNWNAVQKHTGLARCGKSCRLRWANHLRPDLKKGAFTPEEEHLIIELHAKMGNKWARMAAEVYFLFSVGKWLPSMNCSLLFGC